MLQMRPGCECCDRNLPAESDSAMICSFECTFCADCAQRVLRGRCPNCGGVLVARPSRTGAALDRNPASPARVFRPQGCSTLAG